MKAKLTIKQVFQIEIDGKPVSGAYSVVSDWEGMVKLECNGPCGTLIIHPPSKAPNHFDIIPKMLGGNLPNGKPIEFEAEVVRADCGHVGVGLTHEFKHPAYARPTDEREEREPGYKDQTGLGHQ